MNTLLANIYAWMGGLTREEKYWKEAESYASEVIEGRAGAYDLESIDGLITNVFRKSEVERGDNFCIDNDPIDIDRQYETRFKAELPGQMLMTYPYTTTDESAIALLAEDYWDDYTKIYVETVESIYPDENDARRREFWYQLGELTYPLTEWDDEVGDFVEVGKEGKSLCAHCKMEGRNYSGEYTICTGSSGNSHGWGLDCMEVG